MANGSARLFCRFEADARSSSARFGSRFGRWLQLVIALLIGTAILGAFDSVGHARLQPYYVVRGAGLAEVRPKVLFVLDTSGSMNWKAQSATEQCLWEQCEDGSGTEQSRITAARTAIRQVVAQIGDAANFGLMTFEQYSPPTAVPPKCVDGNRFQWSTYYGHFVWDFITEFTGYNGVWRLCDDVNRPYPYLRWDELGVGSVITSNGQTGALAPSPLIDPDETSMQSDTNAARRVQWFPKFMGIRAQLNDETDPDRTVLNATIGDWASSDGERLTEVWEQDFYYWPYVDGFPGYSSFVGWPVDTHPSLLGIAAEDPAIASAALYAPFYLDLSDTAVPAEDWGPSSSQDALDTVLSASSPLVEGGIDAVGETPWASAIGDIPAVPPESNGSFSHDTVASYLKFVTQVDEGAICSPTSAVLITDGKPSPVSEGGETLHSRLADLRRELGVKTYVVGFFVGGSDLNDMACAAAGACNGICDDPCGDSPVQDWDTCADPNDPTANCAFLAESPDQLASVLTEIVAGEVATEVGSGAGTQLNDFGVGADGAVGQGSTVQTYVNAYTQWPSWKGHVVRELCDDVDPDDPDATAPWCVDQGFSDDELEATFGPCAQSRSWDAGECLQQTNWYDRRIYSNTPDNEIYRIADDSGNATAEFREQLADLGLLTSADPDAQADEIAAFVLGRDWPEEWKLPGLANSAPVVVRRIPRRQTGVAPSVPIRDPHCAGRSLSSADELPSSLLTFSDEAWDTELESPEPHKVYQEAVLIGDDVGVLHAFQLDSGNELWGFLPRPLLAAAAAQTANGVASRGQPQALDDHIYGIAATLNHGWVFDDRSSDPDEQGWIHLAVFGMGAGGRELFALDLSHMSPSSPDGPFEILWTSEDADLKEFYDTHAGETWARPALAYEVPNNDLTSIPIPRLVFGTGYALDGDNGRTLVMANALTGAPLDWARIEVPGNRVGDYGTVVDPAVSSHCISRFWPEIQEVYVTDPAGQLFRWDLGNDHAADSDRTWGDSAAPVTQFLACEGAGDTCTVGTRGDVFAFGPAVSANGRIDDPAGALSGELPSGIDQMLVALVSGSPADDDLVEEASGENFHSSMYLLVDDHSTGDPNEGFAIPSGAPKMDPGEVGSQPGYMRLAVTDLERTRTFTPYTGAQTYVETRNFSRRTRPVRAPRIEVTGARDGDTGEVITGIEVYRITYSMYEPGSDTCDDRWYDEANDVWHYDQGAVYEITFRLTSRSGQGFDLAEGANADDGGGAGEVDFGSGVSSGLALESVQQVVTDDCADGNCGAQAPRPQTRPCDNNEEGAGAPRRRMAIPVRNSAVQGFTPLE